MPADLQQFIFSENNGLMLFNFPQDLDVHTWTYPKDNFFSRISVFL